MQSGNGETKRIDFLCQLGAEVTQLRALITLGRRTHRVRIVLQPFANALAFRVQKEHIGVHVRDGRVDTRIEALRGRPLITPWRFQPHQL